MKNVDLSLDILLPISDVFNNSRIRGQHEKKWRNRCLHFGLQG